ncbi:hypothetical protein VTO42DRAFT_6889 [Malbranchea cinnamomea]
MEVDLSFLSHNGTSQLHRSTCNSVDTLRWRRTYWVSKPMRVIISSRRFSRVALESRFLIVMNLSVGTILHVLLGISNSPSDHNIVVTGPGYPEPRDLFSKYDSESLRYPLCTILSFIYGSIISCLERILVDSVALLTEQLNKTKESSHARVVPKGRVVQGLQGLTC